MTLIAGNNTVKGTVNEEMSVEFALKMGKTLGTFYGSPIAVAVDGRNSNMMMKSALMAGIMSVGCDVVDLGMVPTPLIQFYMVLHPEIKGGVTITASFSGLDINGFRVMKSTGIEDPIFEEHSVEEILNHNTQVPGLDVGEVYVVTDFTEKYVDYILSEVDEEIIRNAHLKVCVDCRNNVVANIVSNILMRLSIECITIGGDSSAVDEARMVKLGHVVKGQGMDLGVSLEMDADHCLFTTAEGTPVQGDTPGAVHSLVQQRECRHACQFLDAHGGCRQAERRNDPVLRYRRTERSEIRQGEQCRVRRGHIRMHRHPRSVLYL